MEYYVYSHIRPDTNTIFYIGKGTKDRSERTTGRNPFWHNIVDKNKGEFITNILYENLEEELSYFIESELIEKYGRRDINTGILCNLSDGNDGGTLNFSDVTLSKISKAHKGKILSQETKDKISKSCIGIKKPAISISNKTRDTSNFNNNKSQETKNKISKTLLNHDWTDFREKLGKSILQFSKDGIFIKEWKSIGLASKKLKINRSNIISVLTKKRNSAGEFHWKYNQLST